MGSAARLQVLRRGLESIPFPRPQCPAGRIQLQGSDKVSVMRTGVEPSLHWCPVFSFRAAALVIRFRAMWPSPEWDDCCCLAAESCPALCDPMDCSLPGSSDRGILQERILEWVGFSSSRGSSQHRDWTSMSCIGRQITHYHTTWEAPA